MKIVRPKSLTEMVADEVRTRIIDGRIRLGAGLSEQSLAAELGISKTPVREALLQLKQEGLVQVQPQRGTYVFRLESDQVTQISELREVLELAAARAALQRNAEVLAARMAELLEGMRKAYERDDRVAYRRLDGDYHDAIIDLCGNDYIRTAYRQISFCIAALRSRLSNEVQLNKASLADHREMLRLVKQRDGAALARLMRAHIEQTKRSYLDVLERGAFDVEDPVGGGVAQRR
ncbi:MAG: GntR family transcriptional regulator [Alphaproteobacteria bacterium]|nr:GntR family transcriptional regulator [Alphaproteobacteria bacterium]